MGVESAEGDVGVVGCEDFGKDDAEKKHRAMALRMMESARSAPASSFCARKRLRMVTSEMETTPPDEEVGEHVG